jgi:cytochrome b561
MVLAPLRRIKTLFGRVMLKKEVGGDRGAVASLSRTRRTINAAFRRRRLEIGKLDGFRGGQDMTGAISPGGIARYTTTAIALHWIIAILILANVGLGYAADLVPDGFVRTVVDTHKSTGITVLGLAMLRILWRFSHKPPDSPPSYSPFERFAAHAAHGALYVLIFALPISGWMHDSAWKEAASHPMSLYGLIPWPRIAWIERIEPVEKERLHTLFFAAHTYFAYALYLLLATHIFGALKHQFFDREAELQRMLPSRTRGA